MSLLTPCAAREGFLEEWVSGVIHLQQVINSPEYSTYRDLEVRKL